LRETAADIAWLQALIDASQAAAGGHLRSVFDDERRVSAADLPAVLIHGRVAPIDFASPEHADARACFMDTYGDGWEEFAAPNLYWRIDPERAFTFGGSA
jgi:hypothetical protein